MFDIPSSIISDFKPEIAWPYFEDEIDSYENGKGPKISSTQSEIRYEATVKSCLNELPAFITKNQIVNILSELPFGYAKTSSRVTTEIFNQTLADAKFLSTSGISLTKDEMDGLCAKLMGNGWIAQSEIDGKNEYHKKKGSGFLYKIHTLYEKFLKSCGCRTTLEEKTDFIARNRDHIGKLLIQIADPARLNKIQLQAMIYAGGWLANELVTGSSIEG